MRLIYDIMPPKKGKINNGIKKLTRKIVSLALIVGLNWAGLSAIINTRAYLSDIETSAENTYSAGALDLTVRSGQGNFVPSEKVGNMKPGDSVTRDIYIKSDGSLPFKYQAHSEFIDGSYDESFYNALELKIWYNYYTDTPEYPNYHEHRIMALKYNGLLKDFDDFDTNPDDSDLRIPNDHSYFNNNFYQEDEHWFYFQISLPSDAPADLQNKTCEFKFAFEGWQDNIGSYGDGGFFDVEEIISILQSGRWVVEAGDVVINELMWMGSYLNANDEWIELRNMTNQAIDISDWQITELTNTGEKLMLQIPSGKTISANGYFLITRFDKDVSRIDVEPDLVSPDVVLRNNRMQIKIYKGDWQTTENLIDSAGDGSYIQPSGWHGLFFHLSMERNDISGDGTLNSSWHSCFDFRNSRIYWDDRDIFDLGTPGAANLSEETIEAQESNLAYYIQQEKELLEQGIYPPDTTEEENGEESIIQIVAEEQTEGGIIEEINEIIDEVIDGIVDEIMPDEETGDEIVSEPEAPVIEDVPIIEEASDEMVEEQIIEEESTIIGENNEEIIINEPAVDESAIENEPAIEEEPVVVPENPESNNSNPEEGGDAPASEDSGDTTETPAE